MSRIREKATESEAVVRTITRDIQALDRAKANIVASMTTLKRLQMLGMLSLFVGILYITHTSYLYHSERTHSTRRAGSIKEIRGDCANSAGLSLLFIPKFHKN
jgi:hypothetical protein